MKPHFVFVHGINTGPHEREGLQAKMETALARFGVINCFSGVSIAKWNSVGNFLLDIATLPHHINDALSSVMAAFLAPDAPLVVVAHSMGQPLAVGALQRLQESGQGRRGAMLTLGGPMGNGIDRPYLDQWLPWYVWSKPPTETMGMVKWFDVWNADDPINGGNLYRAFTAATPYRLDVPGTPMLPLDEHSSYLSSQFVYSLAKGLAVRVYAGS